MGAVKTALYYEMALRIAAVCRAAQPCRDAMRWRRSVEITNMVVKNTMIPSGPNAQDWILSDKDIFFKPI